MKEHFRKYCEDEAIRWRHTLGLLAYDPLPSESLAKQLNIPIWGKEEILKYGEDLYEMLLKEEKSSWSGSVIVLPGGKHLILVNPIHAPSRCQATVMHEIAHILLKHPPMRIGGILVREYRKEHEEQAAYLGGCLQIPRKASPFLGCGAIMVLAWLETASTAAGRALCPRGRIPALPGPT